MVFISSPKHTAAESQVPSVLHVHAMPFPACESFPPEIRHTLRWDLCMGPKPTTGTGLALEEQNCP